MPMLTAQSLRTNSSRISAPYLIRLDNDQNGKLDDREFANAGRYEPVMVTPTASYKERVSLVL